MFNEAKQLENSLMALADEYAKVPDDRNKSLTELYTESSQISHWIYGITRADTMTIKSLFFSELWVYACVDLIASEFSQLYPVVKRKVVDKDGKEETEDVADHPVQLQLEKPNNEYSCSDFLYLMGCEYCLTGNALAYRKKGAGIWHMPSELIQPDLNSDGTLKQYLWSYDIYNAPGGLSITEYAIDSRDMLHVMRRNPSNKYWGLSPFVPSTRETQLNRYGSEFLLGYFEKGASPQQILSLDTAVSEKQLIRMLRSFEMAYTGRRNQRKTLMLPKGVKSESVFNKIADPELIKTINDNKDDIRAILKIPPHAFGLQKAGSLGSEDVKWAIVHLWSATIKPMAKAIAECLTCFYQKELMPDEYITFDYGEVEALQESHVRKTERAKGMLETGLTINEVRQDVWERETIEGGNTSPLIAQSQIAQQQPLFNLAKPEVETKDTEGRVQKYLRVNSKEISRFLSATHKAEEVGNNKFKKTALELLAKQGELALEVYRDMTKEFNVDAFEKNLLEVYDTLKEGYTESYQDDLKVAVDTGVGLQLRFTFNQPNSEQVEAITTGSEDERVLALQQRSFDSFEGITQASTDDMVREVRNGLAEGETPQEIIARLAGKAKTWPSYRLERITRTEALTALSLGQASSTEAMKAVYGDEMRVIWLTAEDSKVRDEHAPLHGKDVRWGEEFENGLRFPRDPSGSAGEVINCFPGSTIVESVNIQKVMRSFYVGDMITVTTSSGGNLAGTPNHPVLTQYGWVPLCDLQETHKLIKAKISDSYSTDIYMKIMPTEISKVFNTFEQSGICMRVPVSRANFHGDIPASEVEVVSLDSKLKSVWETVSSQEFRNKFLTDPKLAVSDLFSVCGQDQSSAIGRFAASRGMTTRDLISALLSGHLRPFQPFRFGSSSQSNVFSFKHAIDDRSTNLKFRSDLLNTVPFVDVAFDNVIRIDMQSFKGHVYNLQTNSQCYLAQNYIAHNCRCSYVPLIPEES